MTCIVLSVSTFTSVFIGCMLMFMFIGYLGRQTADPVDPKLWKKHYVKWIDGKVLASIK